MSPMREVWCPVCGAVFRTRRKQKRYCSLKCKQEAYAERKAGEYRVKHGPPAQADDRLWRTVPKSYAEIVLANRRRNVQAGWRGQPVAGGGRTVKNDEPIRAADLPRMSADFKAIDMRKKGVGRVL